MIANTKKGPRATIIERDEPGNWLTFCFKDSEVANCYSIPDELAQECMKMPELWLQLFNNLLFGLVTTSDGTQWLQVPSKRGE